MPTPVAAANAYAQLARLSDPGAGLAKTVGDATAGPSFDALVKEALGGTLEAGRKADTQTVAAASGKANMVDLVTAVAESETAIATLVSVRDRVIQAYQTILQMPI
ncbi:MAG TPA: flagellar hook-basal body complex protein FliE [Xanthobacteraceae bacterium]|nr:flagellar hook-basal body complex protein FliE [Xanthobacteraceae bacterium]